MRYAIHLAYNGTNYCGWQTQPNLPTVQLTLEQAISTLLRKPVAIVGCGRTDTGVHASDFYAHFNIDDSIEPDNMAFKLNSFLPSDISIYNIFRVSDNFHARFSALSRTYQYHVSNTRLPFAEGQYCRIYFEPDIDAMNEAAKVLMEYDDFTSFAKLHTDNKTNICHLSKACWDKAVDIKTGKMEFVFTITSNRFLRNMVRSVTGTLLDIGRGKLDVDGLRAIIEKKDRCAAGVSMPAQGLFLTNVDYHWNDFLINDENNNI
ncbi:MAG: tRNA pseudouridine(38-40) synthase TruA [Bacteroidales bacterium]|nr:tRNA pseudouridine(38-40) synthase TruA [Bacteroidales bacterium]